MPQGSTLEKETAERMVAAVHQVENWQASGRGTRRAMVPLSVRGAPSERIGIVVGIGGPMDRFVQVIEPVFNDSDPWDGGWIIPANPPSQVWCYPPLHAEDYQEYLLEGGPPGEVMPLTDDMDPLPIVKLYGVWVIKQRPLFGYSPYPDGSQFTDCWQTGGIP